jgi:surface protein
MIQIGINIAVKGRDVLGTPVPPVLFTTEWTTTAPKEGIVLPYGVGTYSGTIDWGDGNIDLNDGFTTAHAYETAGTYTVIIDGDCTGWYFGNYGGSPNITSVVHWGQLQLGPDDLGYNFAYCPNLDLSSVSDTLNLTGVTALNNLFESCTSLTTINNINSWDTSAVTNMVYMFYGCTSFNQALSFDTSAVTSMGSMFGGCSVFNQPLTFNTSAVTDMGNMFNGATAFNQALSFDTSLVTGMNSMFGGCSVFNQPLSFDTSSVKDMGDMFGGCSVFNQALSFNTSSVLDMGGMFNGATAFNQNISSWNTGAVTGMKNMFNGATAFNQNIGNWDTSTVENMGGMFQDAPAFNQNIGTWDVENVTNFLSFMLGKTPATFSTTNLNAIYNGWSTQAVQPSLDIDFGTAEYTSAARAGRLILTNTALWTITDGGEV